MSLEELVARAIERRGALLSRLEREETDCVRLFHGATEGVPGLAIDRYGPVLLAQTWRDPLEPGALEQVHAVVTRALGIDLAPCWNHRGPSRKEGVRGSDTSDPRLHAAEGRELGARYDVRPRHRGQDPLLFLDLRVGRRWVRAESAGRSVLNLFSYTCGVGVVAALGGAREVWNVDFAASALEVGRGNAERNGIEASRFVTIEDDVIPVVRQLAGLPVKGRGTRRGFTKRAPRTFDVVVLDPPRWARTPFGAIDVVRDYPSLFKPALLACAPGGAVLATNHVPTVERDDWHAVLRRTAEKAGRAIASIEELVPEEDFPSFDERPPLKIAVVRLA
ncbi:class I SAM-dependent rRNA methyltransferase [Sandaracinus amylolyticus]|uniref:class I SAM-dependent rRNA methyltransferase n=1 Tax=Sandaracinus amylolyticus TaxID=927083 RepID=UPI001F463CDE|nr:class I SAM-dependent methyltransferase [Sandaracinus amylolyticus]UJR78670.1 Ribosomal RNA large subunit methyltransferase I [Sandaracinus amylolyticus]